MRIVLGVSGGIAAYKAVDVLRRLREAGHEVTVVPTTAALEFVGEATWAALSGRPVATGVFESAHLIPHVRLGREADLVVVAPATADLLARAATGRADDLLTSTLLTATCPVLFCPAMHTEMWLHPATAANVATLRERGAVVLDPAAGRLAGADEGVGRLPEPAEIAEVALSLADSATAQKAAGRDLVGLRVVVSAGGTREAIDPVRFLTNASSGRMGYALARAARLRGAEVVLVTAASLPNPAAVEVVPVTTTSDLAEAMNRSAVEADLIVMAAAPADFTAADPSTTKLRKSDDPSPTLKLTQTTDVLAGLASNRRPEQVLVGFAAETLPSSDELAGAGQAKLVRKGVDFVIANDVSGGRIFGSDETDVLIVDTSGVVAQAVGSKMSVAHRILDVVTTPLTAIGSPAATSTTEPNKE